MKIAKLTVGVLGTNCYVAVSDRTGGCFIVDPGDDAPRIIEKIEEFHAAPEAVLLTHGHFDHILAAEALKKRYGIPVLAGKAEEALLSDPRANLSTVYGTEEKTLRADRYLEDGEKLKIAGLDIEVLLTPGHSPGSLSYYLPKEQVLFSGDTLFLESYGRVDDLQAAHTIRDSILSRLFELPDDTVVYPGHMDFTTIRHEKMYNPVYFTT